MNHIFISYAHSDSEFVFTQMVPRLQEADFEVWTDHALTIGDEWQLKIDDAIDHALAIIVVLSPDATTSEYVTYEWSRAISHVPLVPVMYRQTDLHPRLMAIQYLDFTDWQARPWDKLMAMLQTLSQQDDQKESTPPKPVAVATGQHSTVSRVGPYKVLQVSRPFPVADKADHVSMSIHLEADFHNFNPEIFTGSLCRQFEIDKQDLSIRQTSKKHALIVEVEFPAVKAEKVYQTLTTEPARPALSQPGIAERLIAAVEKNDGRASQTLSRLISEVDEEALEKLLESLLGDPVNQNAAASVFAGIGHTGKLFLLRQLRSENPDRRLAAVRGLSIIGDIEDVYSILRIASFDNARIVQEAAYVGLIEHFGRTAVPYITKGLTDLDKRMRVTAAFILGEIHDYRATLALLDALKDEDQEVQIESAEAMGKIGGPGVVESLIKLLDSTNDNLVYAVILALNKLDGVKAVPELTSILANNRRDSIIRQQAAFALGKFKAAESLPALESIIKDESEDILLRGIAAYGIGEIGQESSLQALKAITRHTNDDLACHALLAMGKIGHVSVLDVLIETLQNPYPVRRIAAIDALVAMKAAQAVPHIAELLEDRQSAPSGDRVCNIARQALHVLQPLNS